MKTIKNALMGIAGIMSLLVVNSGSAAAGSKVWEATDCEDHVDREIASLMETQAGLEQPERKRVLLASCEQEEKDRAERRRIQRLELQMFRGDMKSPY